MGMPSEVVRTWVETFNRADADALAELYTETAINHQVAESPIEGRDAIRTMFATGFAATTMVCLIENLFEDGDWAILEWKDPQGLRGCGFFHVGPDRIPARLLGQADVPAHAQFPSAELISAGRSLLCVRDARWTGA